MAHKIEDQDDFEKKLNEAGAKLVIVCISATECDKCAGIEEKLQGLSSRFGDCDFLEVDADMTDVADNLGVYEYPTFHFYRNSKQIPEYKVRGADLEELNQIGEIIEKLN